MKIILSIILTIHWGYAFDSFVSNPVIQNSPNNVQVEQDPPSLENLPTCPDAMFQKSCLEYCPYNNEDSSMMEQASHDCRYWEYNDRALPVCECPSGLKVKETGCFTNLNLPPKYSQQMTVCTDLCGQYKDQSGGSVQTFFCSSQDSNYDTCVCQHEQEQKIFKPVRPDYAPSVMGQMVKPVGR